MHATQQMTIVNSSIAPPITTITTPKDQWFDPHLIIVKLKEYPTERFFFLRLILVICTEFIPESVFIAMMIESRE